MRKALFAVPFGCLVALAAHGVRFGDDHAFGGEGNEALVATAIGGSIALAVAILHAFITAGTTTPTGTIAAARARQLIPGGGTLFTVATALYYGIESLEGHGIEIGLPLLLLGLFAVVAAVGLRAVSALLAGLVAGLVRDFLLLLGRRELPRWQRSPRLRPAHVPIFLHSRRLGRAPPNGRRVS